MSDPGEPSKQSQWMSHWTKGSSSAEPQVGRSNDSPEDAKYDICKDNSGPSNFEIMKSRLFERLMVGISQERASLEHGQKLNSNMKVVVKDARRHAVQNQIDQGDGPIQKSVMQKDVLYAKAVVSKSLSIQKLSELSVDFQKLAGSDDLSSEWNHYPMLAINRKIDSILNPKRKSAKSTGPNDIFVPKQTLKLNMTKANLMAFSSQEYELHSHRTTDETMDHCKHAGGIVSRLEDHAGVMLNPAEPKLKGQLSSATSCSCSKDDSNSSDSLLDEQHTSRYIADSDQEPTCRSREKRLKSSENNDTNRKIGSSSQNQKSRAPGHHKQKGSAGVMFRTSVPGKEFEAAEINCSDKIKQRHLNTQRIVSAANVTGSCIPDPAADISTVNGRGEPVTQPSGISGDSTKRKAPYLFEMLTIPSKAQNMNPEDSLPSGNSTAFGVHMYGTNIGSHLFGANNKSSTETETLSGDGQHVSKSSAGIASLLAQKAISEQLATLCMKGASGFNMNRMRNQESQARTEPGDRWLKRLQIDSKDPHHLPCSKRSKAGDGRPVTGGASSMAPRCDDSDDDDDIVDCDKEEQAGLDEGVKIEGVREASPVPSKSDDRWIGRWCQGGVPVYHEDDHDQRKEVTKPDLASGDSGGLEGQFPSIKAMAMMGRAMSKVRPCQQERRGSFMVWKA
uniref:Uncharacterized protein n=1 Tax=Oryza meridionalis TaxID=40149 RepID=A0A0E0DUI8_9ORYZ